MGLALQSPDRAPGQALNWHQNPWIVTNGPQTPLIRPLDKLQDKMLAENRPYLGRKVLINTKLPQNQAQIPSSWFRQGQKTEIYSQNASKFGLSAFQIL